MAAILRLALLLLLSWTAWAQPLPDQCQQMLLVTSSDWNQVQARLLRYQRVEGQWQPVGKPWPAVLGSKGLAWGLGQHKPQVGPQKREGDGRSPAGIFTLGPLWLRLGIAPADFAFQRIGPDTIAVDDPKSKDYNRILQADQIAQPDWDSYEAMDIPDYDRVLVVNHNPPPSRPGAGSCIFIHRWENRHSGTAGCTALAEVHLKELLAWLRPEHQPCLVQLPQAQARSWRQRGWIP